MSVNAFKTVNVLFFPASEHESGKNPDVTHYTKFLPKVVAEFIRLKIRTSEIKVKILIN